MESLFGKEFLHYEFDKKKVCYVSAEDMPKYEYNHDEWETEYHKNNNRTPSSPALPTGEAIKSHKEKSSLEQHEDASSLAVNWLILVLAKKNRRTQDQQKLTKSPAGSSSPKLDLKALKRCPQTVARKEKRKRMRSPEADKKSPTTCLISPKLDPTALKHCILQTTTREELSEIQLPPVTALIQKERCCCHSWNIPRARPLLIE